MAFLLILLLAVPFAGAVIAAVMPREKNAGLWSLTVTAITAALAVGLLGRLPFGEPFTMQVKSGSWLAMGPIHLTFSLGVDAVSLFLVLMTVLLMVLAITASLDRITEKPRQYYAWMLVLLACMIGVFLARDLLLFYAFFELTLVPSFFLIGVWGGRERKEAASKFFLYTFSASVFTLAAIVFLGARAGTFDLAQVVYFAQHQLSASVQMWVALGLLAAFVVKSAVFPLHTWLPITYVEAPTPATVILAGVMPKLGTYGILRLVIPIGMVTAQAHGLSANLQTAIGVLGTACIVGILYGALIAWSQRDMKRLLAYSSFSHLGFCVLGLLALNGIGLQGSVLYMINHGISTGALFLCVGMLFDRFKTRDQYDFSGMARVMPKLAFFFVLFAMSSIGLPGLNGFVSEFLTMLGAFTSDAHLGPRFGALAALGMILAAIYMLQMVRQVFFGPLKQPAYEPIASAPGSPAVRPASIDLNHREIAMLAPLAVLVVLLGFFPSLVLSQIRQNIDTTLTPTAAVITPAAPASVLPEVPIARRKITGDELVKPDQTPQPAPAVSTRFDQPPLKMHWHAAVDESIALLC